MTPVVAVLNELAKQTTPSDVQFITDKTFAAQAKGIMSHASMPVTTHIITAGKLRRYKHFRLWDYLLHPSVMFHNFMDGGKIVIGIIQSIRLMRSFKPDVVFLKGGYVCLPVGLAARFCHVPVLIHDSDARPGLTNRLLAPRADKIATGYPLENYPYDTKRTHYTGVPINDKFTTVSNTAQKKLKARLGCLENVPLIVAVGGGLGARSINTAMVEALPKLAGVGAYAYIVAGKRNYADVKEAAAPYHNVTVLEFVSEGLVDMLKAADIVVTRASATVLQELAGLSKPIIAIPAKALGDQHKNAAVYEAADAAIIMSDDELAKPGHLGSQIVDLLHDAPRRASLAEHLHEFARPHAARDVATILRELAEDHR